MTNEDIINWLEEQLSGNVSNITIVHDEKAYSKEGKYVYFSYEEEGRVLHGRIEIINKTSKTLLILTLSGGLLVISGIVSIFIIKKRKH